MCELLGISINRPERPIYAFLSFQHGSDAAKRKHPNPDGWGIACYPDDGPTALILKEPTAAHESRLANRVRNGELPRSSTHVLHIRKRGKRAAPPSLANTHPFLQKVAAQEYLFAHDGYFKHEVADAWPTAPFRPEGQTLSERAFCHLLAAHEERLRHRRWDELEAVFRRLNEAGEANVLLSDGEFLAVYCDMNRYKNLSWVERAAPYRGPITLSDNEGYRIDLKLSNDESRRALLFATRPITTGEEWTKLPAGRLVVARHGGFVRGPA